MGGGCVWVGAGRIACVCVCIVYEHAGLLVLVCVLHIYEYVCKYTHTNIYAYFSLHLLPVLVYRG